MKPYGVKVIEFPDVGDIQEMGAKSSTGGQMNARQRVAELWSSWKTATVTRVVARPEDIWQYLTPDDLFTGISGKEVWTHERVSDLSVPLYRSWYAFAGRTFLHKDGYWAPDFSYRVTCSFGEILNLACPVGFLPKEGTQVIGQVEEGERGPRFVNWFELTPQLRLFKSLLVMQTLPPVEEVAHLLMVDGFPDELLFVALAVIWEDFGLIRDVIQGKRPHPATGRAYGTPDRHGAYARCDYRTWWLSRHPGIVLHQLAASLEAPFEGISHTHHDCLACLRESETSWDGF